MKIFSTLFAIVSGLMRSNQRDVIHLKNEGEFKGNVLLSYITDPFGYSSSDEIPTTHTNGWECYQMAHLWSKHGYAVDIIDWDNSTFTPEKDYSFFIDIHCNMERLVPLLNRDCYMILHITGSHWLFQNSAEYHRLLDLQGRRKATLIPRRAVPPSFGIEFADCATILGNEATISTFQYAGKSLCQIPITATVTFPKIPEKDYAQCRNNYLWLGNSGMVHKGLDLVLEAFSSMPDHHLYVCGLVDTESDFCEEYQKELYHTANIHTLGWLDVSSQEFLSIIRTCVGLIYPSCSEGQSGSVVQSLHAGLIPVISYQSGVTVDGFGIILNQCSIDEIREAVSSLSSLPVERLQEMAKRSWEYANKYHTRENFSNEYEKFLVGLISGKKRGD
jgi:glycosyltransferase involved in cell wall biosynthesis